jgi:hypothetical protein
MGRLCLKIWGLAFASELGAQRNCIESHTWYLRDLWVVRIVDNISERSVEGR